MKKIISLGVILILTVAILLSAMPAAVAYTPSYSTIKSGIYYGSGALAAANLENYSGNGSGYTFGYFNSDRDFVSFGATTSETQISMLRDRNMYYSSSSNSYNPGTDGSVVVGCYHVQLATGYSSYSSAKSVADSYTGGFVKYSYGTFYVCVGNYTTSSDASAAASALGAGSVTAGNEYTITVVVTGTSRILFEFEYGTTQYLGVMPRTVEGRKSQTWFKGYRYYGGFQYGRMTGGDITVINYVNIEDYLKGVLPYEMSNSWPIEALKAQALCARTYVATHFNAHRSSGFDVCTTDCCQVYRGNNSANSTTDAAVDQTAGKYVLYNGSPCETYYMSADGGATENSENVWVATLPYLKGVIDPYEADVYSKTSWTVTYTRDELTARMRNRGYDCSTIVSIEITQYTAVGNVYSIKLTDSNGKTFTFSKSNIRSALGVDSIRFSINGVNGGPSGTKRDVYVNDSGSILGTDMADAYAVGSSDTSVLGSNTVYALTGSGEVESIEAGSSNTGGGGTGPIVADKFVITGSGRGHNVGMSQWGAYSMALYHGKTYEEIIKFYFTGVTVG